MSDSTCDLPSRSNGDLEGQNNIKYFVSFKLSPVEPMNVLTANRKRYVRLMI